MHTTASDGALSPLRVVRACARLGLTHAAICDHDTFAGVQEAMEAGCEQGVRVLPGIELSCGQGEEIHLLGYGFPLHNPSLSSFLRGQMEKRETRMEEMLQRLAAAGMPVSREEAISKRSGFLGRMNLAYAMVARGYVSTAKEAFARFLGEGKPVFVPRERLSVQAGIEMLSRAGATPVLAHPGRYRMEACTLQAMLPPWREAGLEGVEVYHASHREDQRQLYDRMARSNGLLVTGGSDSHGRKDGAQIGDHLGGWHSMESDVASLLTCTAAKNG